MTRRAVLAGSILLSIAAGLVVVWQASGAIILILVSGVLAVAFSAAATAVAKPLSLSQEVALAFILVLVLAATGAGIWWGGAALAAEAQGYAEAFRKVARSFFDQLSRMAGTFLPAASVELSDALPPFATVFSSATKLAAAITNAAVDIILITFLSVFFALRPQIYRRGLLAVVPPGGRVRAARALDRAQEAVKSWIAGQAVSMGVVFVATLVALLVAGMPYALVLALLAGLLSFIPTVGPLIAGVAIVVAGFSVSSTMALYGFAIYVLIQFLETYMITPLVQQRAIQLPPAATLGSQLVFGALFGTLGFAFAVPLAAAAKALVMELWVEPMERHSGPAPSRG